MDDSFHLHKPVKLHPSKKASFLSRLFFCWALPLFYRNCKKNAKEEYFEPLKSHKSELLGDELEKAWKHDCATSSDPSLWQALWKVFRLEFLALGFLFIVSEFTLKLSQPWLIGELMNTSANSTRLFKNNCYFYGALIIGTNFLSAIVAHFYQLKIQHLGMKIRVACCSLIYRKILRLNRHVVAESDIGKVINLLTNDVNRFDLAAMYMLQLIIAPLETIFAICCLYVTVGPTSVTGIVFLMLFIPAQIYMGRLTTTYRQRTAKRTDHRLKLMTEIISGIQVIKMFVWEKLFEKMISQVRKLEIDQITKISYIRALNVSFMLFMNRTGIFLCILTHVLTRGELNAKYVFVVSSFYSILRQALTVYFPFGIQNVSETKVSIKRIQNFLVTNDDFESEKESTTYSAVDAHSSKLVASETKTYKERNTDEALGVRLENVSVKWLQSSRDAVLHRITFRACMNELTVITGPVGSGKTTLFYTILKELPLSEGKLTVNGTISYASQEPWLFAGTIRQNILFGSVLNIEKYKKIVKICQLEEDFDVLSNGDGTLVGENGALLSGGQKARVSLARAVYKEADIYLLDNPLSAVDVKVGKKIFQDCICGYLKNKCTILITHGSNFLDGSIDRIYTVNKGEIINNKICSKIIDNSKKEKDTTSNIIEKYKKQRNKKEERKYGKISSEVYKMYTRSGGHCLALAFLFVLFISAQIAASAGDYFIAYWVNIKQTNRIYDDFYLKIYILIITLTIALPIIRSIRFFKYCMKASKNLHDFMFSTVIRAVMPFFKTSSTGRILNRFSEDLGMIDETLPAILMDTCQVSLIVLGSVALITILKWWMIFPTIAIFVLFSHFKKSFIARSRNLKRSEAAARSPIYSHMNTTIKGLTTIKTCNAQNLLRCEFDQFQDLHSSAFYMFLTYNRAFGFWLDMSCVFYTATVVLALTLIDTPVGNIGLGITQSMNLIGVLQWGIRQWSELENQMVNVERVVEYTKIPTEQESKSTEKSENMPVDWPRNGGIEFEAVSLKYAERLALKDLSFTVNAKEKVGIVGRTGAGKSSLISSLFRLFDITGKIIIDDVDIACVPLDVLRAKISIIPQEPILFSGSLRENLDPFREFDDDQLWRVLDQVEVKNIFMKMPDGIDTEILSGGLNLSIGQRQLICLARAILRNNTILVMDEATASIDPQTDRTIQNSIKRNFQNCTILTVAHRLSSIMESDKILVIDDGEMIEFGSPECLLRNPQSTFSELVRQSEKENVIVTNKTTNIHENKVSS